MMECDENAKLFAGMAAIFYTVAGLLHFPKPAMYMKVIPARTFPKKT
jgi:hypothetical protein